MPHLTKAQYARAVKAGKHLDQAARSMRILTSIAWNPSMKSAFLKRGKLPDPSYPSVPTDMARDHIASAQLLIDGDNVIAEWQRRLCTTLTHTIGLVETRGTPEFFAHSTALYGRPTRLMLARTTKVLDLATHMDAALDGLDYQRLVVEGTEKYLTDTQFARRLRERLTHHFETDAPRFMPPWVKDLRFLVSYLAYSSFLNRVKMPGFQSYYQEELKEVPDVWSLVRHDRVDESGEDIITE